MGQEILQVSANFPPKLRGLFEPHRFKVLYGGRGSAKSWSIARAIVLKMVQAPTRVLCAREQMNSLKDSVHKLLTDQIEALGFSHLFEIQQGMIKCISGPGCGSEANFEGIRHNINKIKSYEGVVICWVEEAENVSDNSWLVLIPTIRAAGSEIWISFNPSLETDATYVRFIKNTPPDTFLCELNWRDNPWFPPELARDLEYLKATDYDKYLNVYEGKCRLVLEGAVYAEELREAVLKRICKVPYDPTVGVHTVWDLGWGDSTAIWFVQRVGFETRFIDFYENSRQTIEHYLRVCQGKEYFYDTFWLPHDAKAKSLGTGKSIEEIIRGKGKKTRIVPKLSLVDGINAARTIFPNTYIDKEKCEEGLKALRHYRYELIEDPVKKIFTRTPVHDWTSHAADAFRYAAIAVRQPSSTVSHVANKLLQAEDDLWKRLGRFGQSSEQTSTGWMK